MGHDDVTKELGVARHVIENTLMDNDTPIFEWMALVMRQIEMSLHGYSEPIDLETVEYLSLKLERLDSRAISSYPEPNINSIRQWLSSVLPFNFF